MPYGLRKLPDQDLYKVFNKETGEVHSNATTKGNALKQIRLLYMLERNKETKGGEVGYFKNTYPKLDRSMEQDRTTDYYGGCADMKKCNCKTDVLVRGSGKSKATLEKELVEVDGQLEEIENELPNTKLNDDQLAEKTKERLQELIKIGAEKGGIPYNASDIVGTILYVHLLEKYGNTCAVYKSTNNLSFFGTSITIFDENERMKQVYTPEELKFIADALLACIKKGEKNIIVPTTLRCVNTPVIDNSVSTHANILVWRVDRDEVEHFEPHGNAYRGGNCQAKDLYRETNWLIGELNKIMKTNFNYKEPNETCPRVQGFQALENFSKKLAFEGGGFCLMWSTLMVELILLNPNKTLNEINELAFKIVGEPTNRDVVLNLIRGYVVEAQSIINDLTMRLKNEEFKFLTTEELDTIKPSVFHGKYTLANVMRKKGLKDALTDWALNTIFRATERKQKMQTLTSKKTKLQEKIATREPQGRKKGQLNKKTIELLTREAVVPDNFIKPKAKKTFIEPYQPTGNFMTAWRWVLYKERDLQNSTYAKMMRNPSVKSLYYKLKEKAEDNDDEFNVDWLEANYMKNRRGVKGDEPVVKEKKTKKDFSKGSKKIEEFFK